MRTDKVGTIMTYVPDETDTYDGGLHLCPGDEVVVLPRSAANRTDFASVLAMSSSGQGTDPLRAPRAAHSPRSSLIPPIGTLAGHWTAVHPSLRLNWRRLLWVPIGVAVGAGASFLMAEVYRAGAPLPEAMGVMVAILILLRAVVGPLCFTFFYADQHWIGERGLWWRHGVARADYRCNIGTAHTVDLIGHDPAATSTSHKPMRVRLRLKWSAEQLGPIGRPVQSGTPANGSAWRATSLDRSALFAPSSWAGSWSCPRTALRLPGRKGRHERGLRPRPCSRLGRRLGEAIEPASTQGEPQ